MRALGRATPERRAASLDDDSLPHFLSPVAFRALWATVLVVLVGVAAVLAVTTVPAAWSGTVVVAAGDDGQTDAVTVRLPDAAAGALAVGDRVGLRRAGHADAYARIVTIDHVEVTRSDGIAEAEFVVQLLAEATQAARITVGEDATLIGGAVPAWRVLFGRSHGGFGDRGGAGMSS
jgi:hypothetical protein